LLGYHHDGLDGKSTVAIVEQVFQTGTEQVDDEDVVESLLTKVVDIGNTRYEIVSYVLPSRVSRAFSRVPTRILYVRYSSLSCGASLLRGSFNYS